MFLRPLVALQRKHIERAMTDAFLLVIVVGVLVLALGLDLAALVGWLRGRWR